MKGLRLALLAPLFVLACDDPKKPDPGATPSASVAATTTVPAAVSTTPPPPPPKKKEWKCTEGPNADFMGDAALEADVRLKLSKPKGTITVAELGKVASLNLTRAPVDDLNPCILPKFTGLHDLLIGRGELEDLTPVGSIGTLLTLVAHDNHVADLKPISKLVHLDRLDLGHTLVKDLEPLRPLTELTELSLDSTQISDVTALAGLTKLQKLILANTTVKDLSPLKTLRNLTVLDISGTLATDYSMIPSAHMKVKM